MRWASSTSSSRVISGYWLISRRYWSSDPSSKDTRLAVFRRMESSVNERSESAPANVRQPRDGVVRPPVITEIHQQRPPFDRSRVHEAPVARVRGVIAIISQHEILPRRDGEGTPLIALRMVTAAVVLRARQIELALPLEVGIRHIVAGI